jgi:hypothetical protein
MMADLSLPLRHLSLLYKVESDPASPIILRTTVAIHSALARHEETKRFRTGCPFLVQLCETITRLFCASKVITKTFAILLLAVWTLIIIQNEGTLHQDTQYAHPFVAGSSSDVYQGRLLLRNKQPLMVEIEVVIEYVSS